MDAGGQAISLRHGVEKRGGGSEAGQSIWLFWQKAEGGSAGEAKGSKK